jgi:hypothetical protein
MKQKAKTEKKQTMHSSQKTIPYPLRNFLKTIIVLISIGYALECVGDPFFYILYCQLALLFLIFLLIKMVLKDYVTLSMLLAFIVAFALEKSELSVALGIFFLATFVGRNLINNPHRRKIFASSLTIMIVSAFALFISLGLPKSLPLQDRSTILESLQSLPYTAYVSDEKQDAKAGVVEYHQDLAAPGLNLYNSYYKPGSYLLDMSGNKLHEWRPQGSLSSWHCVAACENGDLLVCIEDEMLMRINWDSRVLWQKRFRTHHDIAIAENKDIYTLISREEIVFFYFIPIPIINDYAVILSPDGTIKKEISLYSLLKKDIPLASIFRIYNQIICPKDFLWRIIKQKLNNRSLLRRLTPFDVLHCNTVTPVDKNIESLCQRGNLLISTNSLDLIGILDIEKEKMRWTWGPGILEGQHHATFLKNGNILIFDNGTRRKYSRLIELDPLKKEIVWEYHSFHPTKFYTSWGGSAQRLPNGNSLVTETSRGRVFEITKDRNVVWEFLNLEKEKDGKRATIYRLTRITDARLQSILLKKVRTSAP